MPLQRNMEYWKLNQKERNSFWLDIRLACYGQIYICMLYSTGCARYSVTFCQPSQNCCIFPKNGRTGPSKVPIEPYSSHEHFDVFRGSIGHTEPPLERFDRRQANFFMCCRLPPFCATEYFFSPCFKASRFLYTFYLKTLKGDFRFC